jgi:hypothetical protein
MTELILYWHKTKQMHLAENIYINQCSGSGGSVINWLPGSDSEILN